MQTIITPDTLPFYFSKKQNRSKEALQKVISDRLKFAIENQRTAKISGSRKNHKDLTTYANCLLENELKPLIELIYDFCGSYTHITHIKHEILQQIRAKKGISNVKQLLRQRFLAEYYKYLSTGRIRISDEKKLASIR